MRLAVGLHESHPRGGPPRESQILERLGVHGEEGTGGSVLGGHVPERGPVGEREASETVAVELDELAHHALLPELLCHGEDEIRRRRALRERTGELEADDLTDQEAHGLAQHGRLGFDAAHAPTQDSEPVHHRGVAVGPDERVRIGDLRGAHSGRAVRVEDDAGEVLDVDLVDDAGVGGHDAEVGEGLLPPAQEDVPLAVPLVLEAGVDLRGPEAAECVDLDGVIDHQLGGEQRIDPSRIGAHGRESVPHRRQVHDGRDAGEILKQHSRRHEGDLGAGAAPSIPPREGLHVLGQVDPPVLVTQEAL